MTQSQLANKIKSALTPDLPLPEIDSDGNMIIPEYDYDEIQKKIADNLAKAIEEYVLSKINNHNHE